MRANAVGGLLNPVDWGIWHWHDTGADVAGQTSAGYVDVSELTQLGWLHGLDKTQAAALSAANFVI